MISPQTVEQSRIFKKEKNLTLELLSDSDNRVAEKYGLVYSYSDDLKRVYMQLGINLEEYNGPDPWRLPITSRYIIDGTGTIRYAELGVDHTSRTDPEHTLNALKNIRQ